MPAYNTHHGATLSPPEIRPTYFDSTKMVDHYRWIGRVHRAQIAGGHFEYDI